MLLNENEMVHCKTEEEFISARDMLVGHGFRFYTVQFDLHNVQYGERAIKTRVGFRWRPHYQFPECIATVDMVQLENSQAGIPLKCDKTDEVCTVVEFDEFCQRLDGFVDMEDLI